MALLFGFARRISMKSDILCAAEFIAKPNVAQN
jgi:hypothetical protein